MDDPVTEKDSLDNYLVVLDEADNVGTALRDIPSGEYLVHVRGTATNITIREPIRAGFKVSLYRMQKGESVRKYGEVIGVAKADISLGDKVHIENISSLRTET